MGRRASQPTKENSREPGTANSAEYGRKTVRGDTGVLALPGHKRVRGMPRRSLGWRSDRSNAGRPSAYGFSRRVEAELLELSCILCNVAHTECARPTTERDCPW